MKQRTAAVLLIVGVVLLLRLPFLNQAIQGDDPYYLAAAEHAQIDPLHPHHARYIFLGRMVDMRGFPHPPLNAWYLAALLAALGDVREIPYHAAYILFSLIAALAMWSLARRFSSQPLLATLLLLAVPAFVVNGNSLESDLPFLAFWLAAVAFFVRAVDENSGWLLAVSAVSGLLAGLAAYQAILLTPVLAAYLLLVRRDWIPGWAAVFAAPAALGAWQLFELFSSGALPAAMLAGYMQSDQLQGLAPKLRNAEALIAHPAWILFPALPALAFFDLPRWGRFAVGAAAGAAIFLDPNPLFWASFGVGFWILLWCWLRLRDADPDVRFLCAWILVFFSGALVLFYAGSARYLLPMAAPVALLAAGQLRPRWLLAGFAAQLAVSAGLAVVNYQHWDGYRQFAQSLKGDAATKRVWINSEWGLRYYLESEGGLMLERGRAVRPGEMVVSSTLAFPVQPAVEAGVLVGVAERQIGSPIPLRIISLENHSAYSVATTGLRPFDISLAPIDRVRAEAASAKAPARPYLEMKDPHFSEQVVTGISPDGWMGQTAVVLLKKPDKPLPIEVGLYIPPNAPARRVQVSAGGAVLADRTFPGPGAFTLSSGAPVAVPGDSVTITITVDKAFSVPSDVRKLGVVLTAVGFR